MAETTTELSQTRGSASFWAKLKLISLIVVCIVLAGLGGIGVALGLMQSPVG